VSQFKKFYPKNRVFQYGKSISCSCIFNGYVHACIAVAPFKQRRAGWIS